MDGSSYFVTNIAIKKTKYMTPLKGTDPKLVSGGSPTRGMIREGMGNMPNLGAKKPTPFSSKPLPTVGKMVNQFGGPQ
jgi:hypothetical protein